MPAVGTAPWHGVFPLQASREITRAEILADAQQHNALFLQALWPGKDDAFLLSQSQKDAEAGFCTPPLKHPELLRKLKGRPYRLIPRCVITQSSGKQRVIDNADAGGQSALSSDANKLVLCTPFRPAQHAAAVVAAMSEAALSAAQAEDSLEGGGEDWPDAYRHCPMSQADAECGTVTGWHQEWGCPAFQIYTGLLFAVTSFNRYRRFTEASGRRLLLCLVSMYFDDAHLTDWGSSKGSS